MRRMRMRASRPLASRKEPGAPPPAFLPRLLLSGLRIVEPVYTRPMKLRRNYFETGSREAFEDTPF
jgi:hypothetical protein